MTTTKQRKHKGMSLNPTGESFESRLARKPELRAGMRAAIEDIDTPKADAMRRKLDQLD